MSTQQKATANLLNAIYEPDFYECSYGFRPGRSPHDALDAVGRIICRRPIAYVLEADMCGYFEAIVRSQLMEMIGRRVWDGSIHRLIGKWIHAGLNRSQHRACQPVFAGARGAAHRLNKKLRCDRQWLVSDAALRDLVATRRGEA